MNTKINGSNAVKKITKETTSSSPELTTCSLCPLQQTLSMGWDGIANMLENSRQNVQNCNNEEHQNDEEANLISSSLQPLILQNQEPLQPDEIQSRYSNNPFASYLDRCSIIQNHAEYFSKPISDYALIYK